MQENPRLLSQIVNINNKIYQLTRYIGDKEFEVLQLKEEKEMNEHYLEVLRKRQEEQNENS